MKNSVTITLGQEKVEIKGNLDMPLKDFFTFVFRYSPEWRKMMKDALEESDEVH